MTARHRDKISIGEKRSITNELEAFAGPGKPRGCKICERGDWKIARVAREAGYTAVKVAEFLIQRHGYPATLDKDQVYRHWHRCDANGSDRHSESI